MTYQDYRGYEITGASDGALSVFESALARSLSWRTGVEELLEEALRESPGFTMAQIMRAYAYLASRDPKRVVLARPILSHLKTHTANTRERMHLAAIAAGLADDYEGAKAVLGNLLREFPKDVLALQIAHAFDYATGDSQSLSRRVPEVLPSWSVEVPGYHAVMAMHGFGLVEAGEYDRAAEVAQSALDLNERDARAYHVLAHVHEMSGDGFFGLRWLHEHGKQWGEQTVVATHMWWHLALLHLAEGAHDDALNIYDKRIRGNGSNEIADLIDASALLWRLGLRGVDAHARWVELAAAWFDHVMDGFCTFNDIHAMLALVGAQDWAQAERLESELSRKQSLSSRHAQTTREIGLPACRAIMAYGRGDYARTIELLSRLPVSGQIMGGSHAQRDILYLTLLDAIARVRRPELRVAA